MAEVSGGELQTLISTLQNGNVQLGHIYQALGASTSTLSSLATQLGGLAAAAIGAQLGAVETHSSGPGGGAALPATPDGYLTVNIPGVGPRLIPYYPV